MALDAVVLAGDRSAARLLYGTNKAFLRLRGKPLLSYVISALDRASEIRSINVVGPIDRLKEQLAEFGFNKQVNYIEQGNSIIDNIWEGCLSTFSEYRRGMDYHTLKDSPEANKCLFVVTCDIPFLEPAEIDEFIKTAPINELDFIFAITRKEMLLPFAPAGGDPGIEFAYFVMKDIIFRQANFFTMRPLKLGYVMDEFIPLVYSIRYQKELKNILSALWSIIRAGAGLGGVYILLMLQMGRYLDMRGWNRLRDLIRKGITLNFTVEYARPVLQTRFGAFETIGPGPCVDTDNEIDLAVADKMFERWKEMQMQMLQGKYPLPQDI